MKGIDHLVLCGHDLNTMRHAYTSLGFTLTPPAVHPFGTQNSLIQLDHVFLELLSLEKIELVPEHAPSFFSFAAFNRDFLKTAEGLSMLVLDSDDARADFAFYRGCGLHTYEPFDFSRKAKLPTGEEATVGFSLTYVSSPRMPRAGFFCCQQHAPQYFWQPLYQNHPNGACTILEVTLVAEQPEGIKGYVELFAQRPAQPFGEGYRIETARGDIAILKPDSFRAAYGVDPPDLSQGPRFAGYTVGLKSTVQPDLAVLPICKFGTAIRFKTVSVARSTGGS
jgi:hypothetical protein